MVGKDGVIRNIEVIRGVDPSLDLEATRVISMMPKWKPGMQKGKEVSVKYTVPVTFRLQGKEDNKPTQMCIRDRPYTVGSRLPNRLRLGPLII